MTNIDVGYLGAKVQSWRRVSPRELLKRQLEENPRMTRQESFKLFLDDIRGLDDAEDYFAVMAEYWHTNNYNSLVAPPTPQEKAEQAVKRKQARSKAKADVKKIIRRKAELMLLDMVMPNGKELSECTGRECLRFGPKLGKFLTKLGETLQPRQKVGEVYRTNDELLALWKRR
jgi:hypothetical protein